jgi:hypothetical protein
MRTHRLRHGAASAASYPRRVGSIIEGAVYDERRVQDVVLALMHLNVHKDRFGWRAWKTFPWEATDGLHERGLISDPGRKPSRSRSPTREHGWPSSSSPNCSKTTTRTQAEQGTAPLDAACVCLLMSGAGDHHSAQRRDQAATFSSGSADLRSREVRDRAAASGRSCRQIREDDDIMSSP